MLFNSLTYLLFLAVMVAMYWLLPQRLRQPLLLFGSFVFYCSWRWEYGFLLASAIAVNYWLARLLHRSPSNGNKALAIGLNLVVLGYYKYLGFFTQTFDDLAGLFGGDSPVPLLQVILPLGISFFTFQCMSYVVDVGRRERAPETSPLGFALYISFWPQLVAGPIVRSHEIIPQLQTRQRFSYHHLAEGLKRILFGLFLKVYLADGIAPMVDEGFSQATYPGNSAIDNWTLAFAFGFQIYFDFAGYSSIAIGSARLLGFRLPENFDSPYAATSPREFWRRWHITLSSWIRDYLYIPLQGVLPGPSHSTGGLSVAGAGRRRVLALLLTWTLMGLWHGAAWTFVLWGLWHAGLVLLHRGFENLADRHDAIRRLHQHRWLGGVGGLVFTLAGAMAGWIFFRAQSVGQALVMLGTLIDPTAYFSITYKENFYLVTFFYTAGFFATFALRALLARPGPRPLWGRVFWVTRALGYTAMVMLVAGFLRGEQQFIYFQF